MRYNGNTLNLHYSDITKLPIKIYLYSITMPTCVKNVKC